MAQFHYKTVIFRHSLYQIIYYKQQLQQQEIVTSQCNKNLRYFSVWRKAVLENSHHTGIVL